jgi:hypothetical protein
MKTKGLLSIVAVAALALAGCATAPVEYASSKREMIKNDEGHVIGWKELMRNTDSGEVFAQVNFFRPVRDNTGDVIGYEEDTREGAVIRDLKGRAIGNRFADLRSRMTNTRSRGIAVVLGSIDTRRAIAKPDQAKPEAIAASLDATDLSALR